MYEVRWPLIPPDVNNKTLRDRGEPEHSLPSWARITCGDKQSSKVRGDNITQSEKRNAKEARDADRDIRDSWDSRDEFDGSDNWIDRSSVVQRLFTNI